MLKRYFSSGFNDNLLKFQKKRFKINSPEVYFNNYDSSFTKHSIDMCKLTPMIEAGNFQLI